MSYTITPLTADTTYWIQVVAVNDGREGTRSALQRGTPQPTTIPAAPVLTVVDVTLATIKVMWTIPANGGATITAFNIYHSVGENADLTGVTTPISVAFDADAGMPTSYRLTDLMSGTAYTVAVTAENANGQSALSVAQSTMTIMDTVPDAPVVSGPSVPEARRIAITWVAPPPANNVSMITGYEISWRTINNLNLPSSDDTTVASSSRSFTIENLKPDTIYYITVTAINDVGPSSLSPSDVLESETATAAPEAPQSLVVTDRTLTSIEVAWQAPLVDNGEEVTAYQVFYKAGVSAGEATQSGGDISSSSTLRHRIIDLTYGTLYQISVRAVNSRGEGAAVSISTRTLSTEPPGIPSTPTLTVLRHDRIDVEWAASMGGGEVDRYRVYFRLEGDLTETSLTVSVATSAMIPAMSNRNYTISVSAENLAGASARSGELEVLTNALSEPTSIVITR